MSLKLSVFVAMSLDGFIARKDGEIDWLEAANAAVPQGEDCGFKAFMGSIDTLVMGRNTYEQVLSFGNWPYGNKHVIVLSSNKIEIPEELAETVSWSAESPKQLYERLAYQGAKRLYIDGGITIQRFMAENLISDMTITIIPVALGAGKPLFGKVKKDMSLKHAATQTFDFGFVQLTYEVKTKSED